jgi:hypothetical protein
MLFNKIFWIHYCPAAWKHAHPLSILKPGKNPGLPSSFRPISLVDTIGKLFERMLLTKILFEVGRRGVMRNEQVGFRTKHSTALQIIRFVERVSRNLRAKRLKRRCFPRWGQDLRYCVGRRLLYKLTVLNFSSYLVKTMSSCLNCQTFEAFIQTATSTCRMRAGLSQGGINSFFLFSLYVNEMPSLSHRVEVALDEDNKAIIATSHQQALIAKYLETYRSDLDRWLRELRISTSRRAPLFSLLKPVSASRTPIR